MMLLIPVVGTAACGKKGPPLSPMRQGLPVAVDIDARMEGDVLTLSWPLAPYQSAAHVHPAGFRVYRAAVEHGDVKCPGCPPWFQVAADISFNAFTDAQSSAEYSENLEAGYQYRFRMTPYMDDGTETGSSNIIIINR